MAKSKMKDRITVSFYDEIEMDVILLEALNKVIPPRMRGNKIKEWAYEYLKSNKELYEQVVQEIENKNKGNDNNKNENNNIVKREISKKLNIVTK